MKNISLKATKRTELGRKAKTLRAKGVIPANVFGKGVASLAVSVSMSDFKKAFEEAGETAIISLEVEGKTKKEERPVLVANVQKDPVSDSIIHIDFHQVDLKEKVEAAVPVEIVGESPAEKQSLGTVVQYLDEVTVEALPADLPEKFEIDAAGLTEVDQAIKVSDLKVDAAKVEIKADADEIIVKVEPPQKEEVVVAPVETPEGEAGAETPEGKTDETAKGDAAPEESPKSEE